MRISGLLCLSACALLARAPEALAQRVASAKPVAKSSPAPAGKQTSDSGDAAATIVVYNENDPDSPELARYYATRRGIPKENLVALRCAASEEISREEYDQNIAAPLRKFLTANGWWKVRETDQPLERVESSRVRFVALIRGVPLKIAQTANYPGDSPAGPAPVSTRNDAAVDSELAALGFHQRVISGAFVNPYHRSFSRIREAGLPSLLLVARLDGPDPATVRRMILDSLAVEKEGQRGFAYVDARGLKGGGLAEGDKWLIKLADDARRRGSPVVLDIGEGMFPIAYPMRHAALYFGWYSEHVSGPMVNPSFRFKPGAIAVHIHSFSAATVRDPRHYWVGPLLVAGAAATLGNVYEPYLSLTPNLDLFHDRLRAGLTFAESAYASQRVLSWMNTFVGDPLYRPFKSELDLGSSPPRNEWDAYRDGARQWFENPAQGEKALLQTAERLKSGVVLEGLGLLQLTRNARAEAVQTFARARKVYAHPEDILRSTIHEVFQLRGLGKTGEALALTRRQLEMYGNSPAGEMLRILERELAPPPLAPVAAPPAPKPGP